MTETAGCACETRAWSVISASSIRLPLPHILAISGEIDRMNIQDTATARSAYAIGEPVKRKEDPTLLRGQGRYTDDINLPNQVYAFILRSTVAHGRIKSINTEAASKMPGVLAIYTGEDLKALRHHPVGAAIQEPRRLRHEEARPRHAADRQGALRRRSDRLRGRARRCRRPRTRPKRSRSISSRCRW